MDDTAGTVRLELADGSGFILVSSTARFDRWHFAVGTWDGTNIRIYVDGVLANAPVAQTRNAVSGVNPVTIGKDPAIAQSFFDGEIDDVRIYNRALTTAEVKQLYQLGAAKIKQ